MRKSYMHGLVAIGFALAALGSFAGDAWAHKVNLKVSFDALRGACARGGGTFTTSSTGGYGCHKVDCDGKGGSCIVDCKQNGKCTGTTPGRVFTGTGIPQILTNGTAAGTKPTEAPGNILGGYGSGSLAPQKPSAVGTPPAAPKPVAPPQVIR